MHLDFKTRLSLWHLVCVALILGVAAFISDWALARLVRQQVDSALLTLANREITAIQRAPDEALRIHEALPGTARPSFERLDKFVQIVTTNGEVLARSATLGTAKLPLSGRARESFHGGNALYETVEDFGEEPIRMISVPVRIGAGRYAVQVASSLDDARAIMRAARWLFLDIAVAILAAVAATGALLARRALVPIDDIVTQARRIGETSLAERLPHPGMSDEIGRLVDTLNDMLERIQKSFEVQRQFTADASHELMSPLSRLRAELEVTLRRPRDIAEYEESLRSCLEEVERLSWLGASLCGVGDGVADRRQRRGQQRPAQRREILRRRRPGLRHRRRRRPGRRRGGLRYRARRHAGGDSAHLRAVPSWQRPPGGGCAGRWLGARDLPRARRAPGRPYLSDEHARRRRHVRHSPADRAGRA